MVLNKMCPVYRLLKLIPMHDTSVKPDVAERTHKIFPHHSPGSLPFSRSHNIRIRCHLKTLAVCSQASRRETASSPQIKAQ